MLARDVCIQKIFPQMILTLKWDLGLNVPSSLMGFSRFMSPTKIYVTYYVTAKTWGVTFALTVWSILVRVFTDYFPCHVLIFFSQHGWSQILLNKYYFSPWNLLLHQLKLNPVHLIYISLNSFIRPLSLCSAEVLANFPQSST